MKTQTRKDRNTKNDKGVILIASCVFLVVLLMLAAGFTLLSTNELNSARRYRDSTAAFWAAEAGINQFIRNPQMLDGNAPPAITIGDYSVSLVKDDSDSSLRVVTATGTANGVQRKVQVEFPAIPPDVFNNTMSTGGDIDLDGNTGLMQVHGKARLGGTYNDLGKNLHAEFDDKVEGVSSSLTTLTFPDANGNGTADEFNDFVEFYRDVAASYSEDEVVYIRGNGTYTITPNDSLEGESLSNKRIIFIEGDAPGHGNVNVVFGTTWENNQDMTIISTGSVNYIQPLESPSNNSRLSVVAWTQYYEPAALVSAHDGLTYAHDNAYLRDVLDISVTHGSLIANNYIYVKETVAWKTFNYDSAIITNIPPGFAGLVGGGGSGYSATPSAWREI
ncbi:MAG TPA: pilus assembly PilX N-terminal domain-containing protein [Candidatus Omnitrophota bacterium]|nr:pilus assembly PilX N-terminal domain-containing protein [Candidatus Omnitrophota bacterium]HPD85223.1 pilus assembly PilX N-terminal domain-containing protein [Candidatus Omnitrophota bacterium]HRZ04276.1 pilus assembly PilX N-terminal domain-containing protein [Candidatus Omnitrophota bacterium]